MENLKELNKDDLRKMSVKDLLDILTDACELGEQADSLYDAAIEYGITAAKMGETGDYLATNLIDMKFAADMFRGLDRINSLLGEIIEEDGLRLPSPDVMEQYKSVIEYANNQASKYEGLANDLREELSTMRKKYEREFYIKNSLFIFLREKGLTGEFKAWYEIEGQKCFPVDFEKQSKSLEEVES